MVYKETFGSHMYSIIHMNGFNYLDEMDMLYLSIPLDNGEGFTTLLSILFLSGLKYGKIDGANPYNPLQIFSRFCSVKLPETIV